MEEDTRRIKKRLLGMNGKLKNAVRLHTFEIQAMKLLELTEDRFTSIAELPEEVSKWGLLQGHVVPLEAGGKRGREFSK